MNRGVARRTVFESRSDRRLFLAALAGRVRAGELTLHAFCLMTTHYHLLVESPSGRLAEAMHRVQLAYSRAFNRKRKRDGPLVRGRYCSKPVRSLTYRRVLVRYIDMNPVRARLVESPQKWPYGSAFFYARKQGPAWLERRWVEGEVSNAAGTEHYAPQLYGSVFGEPQDELERVVEARLECSGQEDPLDELLNPTPGTVIAWLRRKTHVADGTRPFLPVCDPATVSKVIEERARTESWQLEPDKLDGWKVALICLSIELCGSTQAALAARLGCSDTHVSKVLAMHRRRIHEDPGYAERVEGLARELLSVWRAGS